MRPALTVCALALLATGCSYLPSLPTDGDSFLGVVTPYRMEIVQGNVVTREMAAGLKPGLTRVQVRELLGSPLLTDIFHADRWDYVFSIRRQGAPSQQRRVTLFFKGETLESFEAGELPSEQDFVASIDTRRAPSKPPVLALTEEQVRALPVPAKTAPARAIDEPQGPARSYPPLEPAQ